MRPSGGLERTFWGLPGRVWAWCTFDIANSSYSTVIISVCFSVVFSQLVVGVGAEENYEKGNFLWSAFLAGSWALSALLGPWIGVVSDRYQKKRAFLLASVLICSVASATMFFIKPGSWFFAGLLLVISNFGFTLSEMTIASFLPGMVEKKSIGKVSGWGWAFGYIGGLLSLVLAFKLTHFNYDLNNWSQLRFLGPMIAVFFIVASLPTLLFVPEPKLSIPLLSKSTSWQSDLRIIFSDRKLRFFLLCYFLIHGNVMTAVSFSALLGTQVAGVVGSEQAVFYIGFQVVAASGAFLFGKITDWLGNQRTLQINLVLWLIGIGLMTELIFFPLAEIVGKKAVFYCAGAWCGLSLGATLSNSRALVAEFAPEGAGGRALGIWSAVGSLASIAAVVTFGKVQTFFSLSQSLYLVWGGFLLAFFLLRSKSFSR